MKRVSVIMPCYNDGAYIEEAIASVLSQTYKNIELIIIDDGSDDQYTMDVLGKMKNDKIKIITTKQVKPAAARNEGIKNARGTYILPVDADDIIEPTYVEKCVAILENDKSIGVVYCQAELFGERTGKLELPECSLQNMLIDNVVFVTAMFRKSDWESVGGFSDKLKHGLEDYDFWLSLLQLGVKFYQIPSVLFRYRIKPGSRNKDFSSSMKKMKETYRQIYLNHRELYDGYKEYAMLLRDMLIEEQFKGNQDRFISSLYLDTGKGYNEQEVISEIIEKVNSNQYSVKFEFTEIVKTLRFDPIEDKPCKVRIIEVKSNANKLKLQPLNANEKEEDGEIFFHTDPIYEIVGGCENVRYIEIVFELSELSVEELSSLMVEITRKNNELHQEKKMLKLELEEMTTLMRKHEKIVGCIKECLKKQLKNSCFYKNVVARKK